ncbi:hypothetical protein V8D89_007431 [Ganoderma adspersum]
MAVKGFPFTEAVDNAGASCSSWWGDVQHALAALTVPVHMDGWQLGPNLETITTAMRTLSDSLAQHLYETTMASAHLPLVQAQLCSLQPNAALHLIANWRPYLDIVRAPHRAALVHLVVSEHPLAVEMLRHSAPVVPRDHRVCRLCSMGGCVEDECHVLLGCEHEVVARLCTSFFTTMWDHFRIDLAYLVSFSPLHPKEVLAMLLQRAEVAPVVGEYVELLFHTMLLVPPLILSERDLGGGADMDIR